MDIYSILLTATFFVFLVCFVVSIFFRLSLIPGRYNRKEP